MEFLSDDKVARLVIEINNGSEDAFARFYTLYYAPLCVYAHRFIKDRAAAEDLVEDSFVKLWEQRRQFKTPRHLGAFLYQTIKNACLDFIKVQQRSVRRHEVYAETNYTISDADYLSNIVRTEIMVSLNYAIAELPPRVGAVIEKTYIDGKSNQEVADELGISLQTVKNQKNRGLVLLRKRLGDNRLEVIALWLTAMHELFAT